MRRFVSFLIAALAFPLCCLAQDASTGAIQGIVLDPSNSRIAGATVALVNDATGFHYEQTTDSVGRFAFELLPPGEYSARVTADGMPPQLSQNLRVNVGPAAEIEFKLAIAGARESVTVSAEPRLAETQPRGLTAVIDERAILGLSLGVRYDVQTFATRYLKSNPLWPDSGKVALNLSNFAPRAGVSYSFGDQRAVVARVGYGLFYPRIPQIYNSAIETENGLSPNSIFLNQRKFADQQVFPQYPIPLENCAPLADSCALPASLMQFATSDISSFAHNFRTPEVHQASLSIEREVANPVIAEVSYSFVHGQNLIRARDVNLPKPASVQYPIFDSSGLNLLGYGAGQTFSTWQFSSTLTCPFPPCINPLARPLPQLRAISVFESAASSVYQGATISQRRQMTHG